MKVKLGDICDILDNKRIPITANKRIKGKYPYYGANGIQDYVNDYIFDDELVLLAEDGGHFSSKDKPIAYRVSGKCWVNNHAHVLKPKEGIDVDYLCYSLMFYDVSKFIKGATRKKLTQSDMRNMLIYVPSFDEQKKIANILDKVTNLIELRKKQLEKLDIVSKALFVEMFGDPVENPMNWKKDKLMNLGYLGRGISKHRPRNDPKLLGGKYPLIQTGDISKNDLFIDAFTDTYSEDGLKQSKLWNKNTLCITIAANIAKTSILAIEACFPDSIVGFVPEKKIDNIFLHYWFKFFQKILEEQAPESAQKNINLKILSNLNVIVPPIELQNKFAKRVEHIDKTKSTIQDSSNKLETLKKSLMQEYFG